MARRIRLLERYSANSRHKMGGFHNYLRNQEMFIANEWRTDGKIKLGRRKRIELHKSRLEIARKIRPQ